jgi:hypothetical protein
METGSDIHHFGESISLREAFLGNYLCFLRRASNPALMASAHEHPPSSLAMMAKVHDYPPSSPALMAKAGGN